MAQSWLRFERERGSADDLLQALIKTDPILSEAAAHAIRKADPHLDSQTKVMLNDLKRDYHVL